MKHSSSFVVTNRTNYHKIQCDQIGQNSAPWAKFSIFGAGKISVERVGGIGLLAGISNCDCKKYEKSSDKVVDF